MADTLPIFLDFLSSQHSDIKLATDIKANGCISVLDTLVTPLQNSQLGHFVCTKPTYTDQYLHTNSDHHPAQRQSVISSLAHRAIWISQPDNINMELNHVEAALLPTEYRFSNIQRLISSHPWVPKRQRKLAVIKLSPFSTTFTWLLTTSGGIFVTKTSEPFLKP